MVKPMLDLLVGLFALMMVRIHLGNMTSLKESQVRAVKRDVMTPVIEPVMGFIFHPRICR
jgi:hypothetical protein